MSTMTTNQRVQARFNELCKLLHKTQGYGPGEWRLEHNDHGMNVVEALPGGGETNPFNLGYLSPTEMLKALNYAVGALQIYARDMDNALEAMRQSKRNFQAERLVAADEAYQNYEFGDVVGAQDGWEWTEPGASMSRKVYLENDEGPSTMVTFTVTFKSESSTAIEDCYVQ